MASLLAAPTVRFTAVTLLMIAYAMGSINSHNSMVYGQSCAGDIPSLVSQCAKYVRKVGAKSPPSAQCCSVARNANVICLCKYVTQGIEKFVSVDKAVYIAQYCGLPFQHGTKCGMIALLLVACIFAFGNNFMAYGQCEGDISGVISQCAKYVRKDGPKTPPSSQCCATAKKANIPCLCKYVNKDVEQYVSVEKAVYVAQYCGVTFQHGSKCGSYTIP